MNWFLGLPNKKNLSLAVFDIVEFYPSIPPKLLKSFLQWSENYTVMPQIDETIMHARRTILFHTSRKRWVERELGQKQFDVLMGTSTRVRSGQIIRPLPTFPAGEKARHLHRRPRSQRRRLSCTQKCRGQRGGQGEKKLTSIFKEMGLKITTGTNP